MTVQPGPAAAAPALSFHDLTLGYERQPVLRGISGGVARGARLALVGPNGAGKSTLLKGIVGEADILAGRIERHGATGVDVAYLPQQAEIDRTFPITVADFAAMGLWRRLGVWRRVGRRDREGVAQALARAGLDDLARRPIGALSGGQLQRVLFARTIVQDCGLILLDEPFAGVDGRTAADLLGLILDWGREGRTVLAALHDLNQVRAAFDRTLLLAGQEVAWGPTADVLTPEWLAHAVRPARMTGAAG